MKRLLVAAALTLAALPFAVVSSDAASTTAAPQQQAFFAVLTGAQQVPAVQSNGVAVAAFVVSQDRSSIEFYVAAKNLSSNITQAHIHLGAAGANGPVVVFLVRPTSVSGQAFVTVGKFTPADQVGPLAGQTTFDQLLKALGSGNAYVNIHTVNFPAGEVRGQTKAVDLN